MGSSCPLEADNFGLQGLDSIRMCDIATLMSGTPLLSQEILALTLSLQLWERLSLSQMGQCPGISVPSGIGSWGFPSLNLGPLS